MNLLLLAGIALLTVTSGMAQAQTRAQRCEVYARDAMRSTPTSTGAVRGAARGAIGGAVFGRAGRGAAAGAVVGGTRRAAQKSRSYRYYYDLCMRR